MNDHLLNGIVAILTAKGVVAGTGFVVGPKRLIVTCAHVIEAARQASEQDAPVLRFHASTGGKKFQFQLVEQYWRASNAEDVAILQIREELPEEVQPLVLGSSNGKSGHEFKAFGFPKDLPDGINGYGTIGDPVIESGQRLVQMTGAHEVTLGFSGAPVLDRESGRIVGMVTSITSPDRNGRLSTTAFITPSEVLREVCPELKAPDLCPYRGVDVFTEKDAEIFQGRDDAIAKLVQSLRQDEQFLAIIGPSGSGKSSLVRAGLLPELDKGVIRDSDKWGVVVTNPVTCPVDYSVNPFHSASHNGIALEAQDLTHDVATWLSQHPDRTRLILVIDQFEELLIACPEAQRKSFARQLAQLLEADLPLTLIIALREDFYAECLQQQILVDWLKRSDSIQAGENPKQAQRNDLFKLKESDVRAIIVEPAKQAELLFEEGLVEVIVNDVFGLIAAYGSDEDGVQSTILPLLEIALTRLWEKRNEEGFISRKDYISIGRITTGLKEWAFSALEELKTATEQQKVQRIFTDLVSIEDVTLVFPDILNPRPLSLLCRNDDTAGEVHQLVYQLANKHLLVTTAHNDEAHVQIISKALLWEWDRLRRWLEKDADFLRWHQQILTQALDWNEKGRPEYKLIPEGPDLKQALGYLNTRKPDLRDIEQEYIQRSQERLENVQRLTRRAVLGGFVTLIAAPYLGCLTWAELPRHSADALYTYNGYSDWVLTVAWSPNKNYDYIASGTRDRKNLLDVWNAMDGTTISRNFGHHDTVTGVAWSPNGNYIASTSDDRTVQLWSASTGKTIRVYHGHTDQAHSVAWSPNGNAIASSSNDKMVRVWDATSDKLLYLYRGHLHYIGFVWHIAWSPDGTRIASASSDKTVHVWDAFTGQHLVVYRGHSDEVIGVSWSPNGKYLASSGKDTTVQVWNAVNAETLYVYRGHKAIVHDVAWSPDGKYLASASGDRTAQVWDAKNGRIVLICTGHTDHVNAVAWSPDGMRIASASFDGTVKVWKAIYPEKRLTIWEEK